MKSELVMPAHLARRAVVHIRQSTPAQVVSHRESLRLRYALVERARELGWRASDVDVIDADLGLSGAPTTGREGFKELAARVGLGEVGLVPSTDATRLARTCSDWYPLLGICALRSCLIAGRDGVHDPGSPNGRLLLGLKGTISGLELHMIRSRLTAGLLAKAARGELALTLPVGLVRGPGEDDEIAAVLTREGHRSPRCPDRVLLATVQGIRLAAGLRTKVPRTRWCHAPDRLGVTAMAERMGIPAKWLHVQIRAGRILLHRQPGGAYLFDDSPDVIASLRPSATGRSSRSS